MRFNREDERILLKINDIVLYGAEGVCKIKDITRENFGEGIMEYYVLQPIYKDSLTIFVHTGNDHLISKMRRVLSREEIEKIILTMPEEELLSIEDESAREIKYQEIINSGDRRAVVKLIKTIYLRQKNRKEQKKKPYAIDERFLKEAEKLLYDEFALVLNVKPNQVLPLIIKQIEYSKRRKANVVLHYILKSPKEPDNTKNIKADSKMLLRKVISKDDLTDILSRIPYIRTIQAPNNKILEELYETAMAAYDELEWIRVIKTAYLRKEEGKQMPFEEKYSRQAKNYFHLEISVIMDIPFDKVEDYIASAIADDLW